MVTTKLKARAILADATETQMRRALAHIACSALDPDANGNDTAEVCYEQLGRLGIVIP
jgi:hypothetical protein